MNNKYVLLVFALLLSLSSFAQQEKMTREDKDEKNEARSGRIKDKTDYALFHRQMLSLKEYLDERKKIPNLQKVNKMPVKVLVVIDSVDDGDDSKKLMGYVTQNIGDNTTNIYEVAFDRTLKKIIAVKHTAEATEAEKEEASEKTEKTTVKKTEVKKTTVKKKSDDDDDDDDAEDAKPAKSKNKKDTDDD